MAENGLSSIPKTVDDENVAKESSRNNANSLGSKASDDNKKPKSSFFSRLRKRFSFRKKSKSKEAHLEQNNNVVKQRESIISGQPINSGTNKSNLNSSDKSENRFSVIRRSFGKGKSKENVGSNKDLRNSDITKNRDSLCQSQVRPQSMHIANSYPPRNGLLASFGWYWGPLSRSEATHRLRHQEDGSFLVRDSEGDPNKFTLSFKGAGQIFHNRILQNQKKYAFLPDEEFDSIPDLIVDAMRRSATSAYCFSRSTDITPTNPSCGASESHKSPPDSAGNGSCTGGNISTHHKHEVRLLKSISRFSESPRSLSYLCRFIIRQYTRFQDLCKLVVNPEMLAYLEDHKYNL